MSGSKKSASASMSKNDHSQMQVYFSDFFSVDREKVEAYGAFDVSLVADLPLFVDPFLIFNSSKSKYQELHREIISYLTFLRDKSTDGNLSNGLIAALFRFPEIRQNWLGFSASGNSGRGLGRKFATALHANLNKVFDDFGDERITKDAHLEKLCLISNALGATRSATSQTISSTVSSRAIPNSLPKTTSLTSSLRNTRFSALRLITTLRPGRQLRTACQPLMGHMFS